MNDINSFITTDDEGAPRIIVDVIPVNAVISGGTAMFGSMNEDNSLVAIPSIISRAETSIIRAPLAGLRPVVSKSNTRKRLDKGL